MKKSFLFATLVLFLFGIITDSEARRGSSGSKIEIKGKHLVAFVKDLDGDICHIAKTDRKFPSEDFAKSVASELENQKEPAKKFITDFCASEKGSRVLRRKTLVEILDIASLFSYLTKCNTLGSRSGRRWTGQKKCCIPLRTLKSFLSKSKYQRRTLAEIKAR